MYLKSLTGLPVAKHTRLTARDSEDTSEEDESDEDEDMSARAISRNYGGNGSYFSANIGHRLGLFSPHLLLLMTSFPNYFCSP
jgi:hypothetical protein